MKLKTLLATHRPLLSKAPYSGSQTRHISQQPSKFFFIDNNGTVASRSVNVWLGEPSDSFALVSPEIGNSFKEAFLRQNGASSTIDSGTCPLIFNHTHRCFSTGENSSSRIRITKLIKRPYFTEPGLFPRLVIPQNMPKRAQGDISPATLYLIGVNYNISIQGTEDG